MVSLIVMTGSFAAQLPTGDKLPEQTKLANDLLKAVLEKDYAAATKEFERATARDPHDFWPHFYAGICAYRLGRPEQAIHAFDVAVVNPAKTKGIFLTEMLNDMKVDTVKTVGDVSLNTLGGSISN